MANKLGIENYWKVMSFLLALGVDVDSALADGKINIADLQYFYKEFFGANTAWQSKDQFISEGLDLTAEEANEIHKRAKEQLGETNDSVVKQRILSTEKFIGAAFEYFSSFKKPEGEPAGKMPTK